MTHPANTVSLRLTRLQLHEAGISIEQYDSLIQQHFDIMPEPNPTLLQSLAGLHALAITLPKYNGNTLVTDWLEDFDRYSEETSRTTDANKLFDLISHLGPEAKQWFQLLPDVTKTDYNTLHTALQDIFPNSARNFRDTWSHVFNETATKPVIQGLCQASPIEGSSDQHDGG